MTFILLLTLIVFSFFLIKSADLVVLSLKGISARTHARTYAVSAIVLALGTSFPEMFVGITSAFEQHPEIALGVVVGSNIANISLVTGIAGLSAGKIIIRGKFLTRDVWIALIAGLAPLILISDGTLSRGDGAMLMFMYGAYASSFFRGRFEEVGKAQEVDQVVNKFARKFNNIKRGMKRDLVRLGIGLALMLVSADVIVRIAKAFALSAGLPVFVVGLVVLAIGTSLPELVFSFRSLKNHESGMFFGNILGSTIANSTLVIGITALIHPIVVTGDGAYGLAAITFVFMSLLFWFFSRTKSQIDWWESGILLVAYSVFVFLEVSG